MMADLDALEQIAGGHNLWLVEDAAQAHGASRDGRRVGSAGRTTCFSFYPSKNLGAAGDAGMILTADEELALDLRQLRDHGRTSKYEHGVLGYGARLDTLQAAVLDVKLRHLDDWTARRRAAAERYDNLIGERLEPVGRAARVGAVNHVYAVRVPGGRRDDVVHRMQARGVGVGVHYPIPLHRQPAFQGYGVADVSLPVAEQAAAEVVSLPLYPEITIQQQERVVETLFQAIQEV
jgi:dTDP-4-amino-4,6-dideoxygalactose transaminase